jgi:peptide/nickel transport system substrate-binding protein
MKRRDFAPLLGAGMAAPLLRPHPAAAQPQPARRSVTVAQPTDALTMDPARHSSFPTANVLFQVFDALVTQDAAGAFQPALALSWSNPDPLTWRFLLRPGVKFHNGQDFDAAAVKFTFDRALDPAFRAPYFSRIAAIKSVVVVDRHTVDLKTEAPFPTMLWSIYEASFPALIVPPGDAAQGLANTPIGTGPYRFVEWRRDDRVVLEANPDYWGGAPAIPRVVFRPIRETRTRIAELRSGGVQIAVDIPPEDIAALDGGATRIANIASDFLYFFNFDMTRPGPLLDRRVRQAINHAVDVDAIQRALLGGLGQRTATVLPTNAFGYDPAWRPYAYDPARARALLAEAGHRDGFAITLTSRQGRYLKDKEIMEASIGFLRRVGIRVTANYLEPGVWAQVSERKGREGLIFGGWSGRDPDLVWYPLLYTGQYQSYYSNPALDALLVQGRSTLDEAERRRIYGAAQAMIHEDAPFLPMLQPPLIYGMDAKLDWSPRTDSMIDLRRARFA